MPTTNIEEDCILENYETDDLEEFLTECPEFCRAAGIRPSKSYSPNMHTVCA